MSYGDIVSWLSRDMTQAPYSRLGIKEEVRSALKFSKESIRVDSLHNRISLVIRRRPKDDLSRSIRQLVKSLSKVFIPDRTVGNESILVIYSYRSSGNNLISSMEGPRCE